MQTAQPGRENTGLMEISGFAERNGDMKLSGNESGKNINTMCVGIEMEVRHWQLPLEGEREGNY